MNLDFYLDWALVAAISLSAALVALVWLKPKSGMPRASEGRFGTPDNQLIWIFDDTRLADATAMAQRHFDGVEAAPNWNDLYRRLAPRFPDFPVTPDDREADITLNLVTRHPEDPATVTIEIVGGMTRVQLHESPDVPQSSEDAEAEELRSLRETLNLTPYPIWNLTSTGTVDKCNFAYSRIARTTEVDDPSVPIFPVLQSDIDSGKPRRVPVVNKETGQKHWYDMSVVSGEKTHLCFAIDVDPVVEAENAQRNFVQTLAKTFAQLSIGLAIFDRNRQLALFNPALIDLTNLSAEFLSARPTLFSFFDRMRDQRMMPEPKDYGTWRQKISALIEAAADGSYQETWTLPSGSVYSISGRPHPDGAIAFLFEDITAEITLTRRFRSDIELSQSILDQIEDAVVVFGGDGTVCVTNRAYRRLWRTDPERSFAATSVIDATRLWQDNCRATPIWGEIRDFAALRDNRAEWFAEVTLLSGDKLRCQVSPLQTGATMLVFSRFPTQPDEAQPEVANLFTEA